MRKHGIRATYDKLNQMLDDAINGDFEESDYDESELSKLETKWKRYFASSALSQKRIEEEQNTIKELVTNISHQTKTPLANILLYTQLLNERPLDEESAFLVKEIQTYSEKLDFLIQSLVKLSRLETGTYQFTPVSSNLLEITESVAREAMQKAAFKHITIHIDVDAGHAAVFDQKWTKEAIYNILDNAIKYSPENSTITIHSREYELFSCLCITDKGIGISEEEIPKIFGRFYRGLHVREQEGVGIGLYLSRQIIENQNGYIKVSSKLGQGSSFQIYLPKK